MLKNPPFSGTIRIANKGEDVALVVSPAHTEEAMKAARLCGVRGISTAVLEVTRLDPPDQRTLEYFCGAAGGLVFADRTLLAAHRLPAGTRASVAEECTVQGFSRAVSAMRRER